MNDVITMTINEMISQLIAMLEKQVPMKPSKINDEVGFFVCNNCNGCIGYTNAKEEHKYCLMCGQKLDWDE